MISRFPSDTISRMPQVARAETCLDYLEQIHTADTKKGYRSYSLLCVAMTGINGTLIVRKDPFVHHLDPTDWLMIREVGDEVIREHVIQSKVNTTDDGDEITLMLAPHASHHAPSRVKFRVNSEYTPTNEPILLTRPKYYGRGVLSDANVHVEATYDIPLLQTLELAEVVPIDMARSLRHHHVIDDTAIAN